MEEGNQKQPTYEELSEAIKKYAVEYKNLAEAYTGAVDALKNKRFEYLIKVLELNAGGIKFSQEFIKNIKDEIEGSFAFEPKTADDENTGAPVRTFDNNKEKEG